MGTVSGVIGQMSKIQNNISVEFTGHALKRMEERNITMDDIEWMITSTFPKRNEHGKNVYQDGPLSMITEQLQNGCERIITLIKHKERTI